ncbi:unnamed protein product [Pleuronectes platessa]|uniref:Uncharacterized protein n=1 Tax=Pleuronectes platessa TaxID=8262 RepID=A0A9N7U6D2_PLEPL|nr:unnamed protein product [Pleuronectes platessa]
MPARCRLARENAAGDAQIPERQRPCRAAQRAGRAGGGEVGGVQSSAQHIGGGDETSTNRYQIVQLLSTKLFLFAVSSLHLHIKQTIETSREKRRRRRREEGGMKDERRGRGGGQTEGPESEAHDRPRFNGNNKLPSQAIKSAFDIYLGAEANLGFVLGRRREVDAGFSLDRPNVPLDPAATETLLWVTARETLKSPKMGSARRSSHITASSSAGHISGFVCARVVNCTCAVSQVRTRGPNQHTEAPLMPRAHATAGSRPRPECLGGHGVGSIGGTKPQVDFSTPQRRGQRNNTLNLPCEYLRITQKSYRSDSHDTEWKLP